MKKLSSKLALLLAFTLVFQGTVPALPAFAAQDNLVEAVETEQAAEAEIPEAVKEIVSDEELFGDESEAIEEVVSEEETLGDESEAIEEVVSEEEILGDEEELEQASPSDAAEQIPEEEELFADGELDPEVELELATPSNAKKEAGPVELKKVIDGISIVLTAEEGAFEDENGDPIPSKELSLKAVKLTKSQIEELLGVINEEEETEKTADDFFFAYDVTVQYKGEEIQPVLPVSVTFEGIKEQEAVDMYHFDSEGEEYDKVSVQLTEAESEEKEDKAAGEEETSFTTEFDHFSPILLGGTPSSVGDLWTNWDAIAADFPEGQGTEAMPFEITNLNELMAVSFAIAAGTGDYDEAYYSLMADIDLSDMDSTKYPHWNPIGWMKNAADTQAAAFKGHFNGNGYTINGLSIIDKTKNLQNVGLFGLLEDAVIEDLIVISDTVAGYDKVGILAGEVTGESIIRNVTVQGPANSGSSVSGSASARVGGIAGLVSGTSLSGSYVTIEDCNADNVTLIATGTSSSIGGIVGQVSNAYLVDNVVTATSQRIQGQGYVGGIAGYASSTNIYNSLVYGTIGGQGSIAAGGMIGKFQSGQLILARFAGTIGATNRQVSHEGLFIGTRDANTTLNYGIESDCNASYWFTTESNKSKKIINGSGISTDNTVAKEAHIGYWKENELKYVIWDGVNEVYDATEYFYQELERGVKHIVVNKLGREFTVTDYAEGLPFAINHYAPGQDGAPVRGYLVSVPVINAKNASGSYDQDVATLVAYPRQNSSYYRTIDKDTAAAVAPGEVVSVTTAAKNSGQNYYQMVVDDTEPGGVKPPTYTDEDGDPVPMTYVMGGGYTFNMPECDSELNVEYVKVTTSIKTNPANTSFHIVQTRTGDRKNPVVTTEVWNADNSKRLSTYEVGKTPTDDQVDPLDIEVIFNSINENKTVKWSIDDNDLVNIQDTPNLGTYAVDHAKIKPEMDSNWMANIITTAVTEQVNNSYKTAIKNTTYTKTAVLTAETDPDFTSGNVSVYANCQVEVTFQIVDNTYIAVEGVSLSADELNFEVIRTLQGDRTKPTETWFVTSPKKLTATLNPDNPLTFTVEWAGDESAKKAFGIKVSETTTHDAEISVKFDKTSTDNPAWIQNVITADNDKRALDKYTNINGSASIEGLITVTANDQTHGQLTDTCKVKINFTTKDETIIHPEDVEMNPEEIVKDLVIEKTGDAKSADKSAEGFTPENITSLVLPNLSFTDAHTPYDRSVTWTVSDTAAISITQSGELTVNKNAKWIKDAQAAAPYSATKVVYVYCTANDNGKKGATKVTLNYETKLVELPLDKKTMDVTLTATGYRSTPTYTWTGNDGFSLKGATYPEQRTITYTSSNTEILTVNAAGAVSFVADKEKTWIKEAMKKSPYTAAAVVTVTGTDGPRKDACEITVNFKYVDKTYSSSSSGGGGGGGGGGGVSGGGTVPSGNISGTAAGLPTYVISGTWVKSGDGTWRFTSSGANSHTFTSEWGAIYNPYATGDQAKFDWFVFDANSIMITGWHTDPADGNRYYLSPVSDNTLGHMVVGYQYIDGVWYYFHNVSDGTRGHLVVNGTTPDGHQTNALGQILVNGKPATDPNAFTVTLNTTASLIAAGAVGTSAGPTASAASSTPSGSGSAYVAPAGFKRIGF